MAESPWQGREGEERGRREERMEEKTGWKVASRLRRLASWHARAAEPRRRSPHEDALHKLDLLAAHRAGLLLPDLLRALVAGRHVAARHEGRVRARVHAHDPRRR